MYHFTPFAQINIITMVSFFLGNSSSYASAVPLGPDQDSTVEDRPEPYIRFRPNTMEHNPIEHFHTIVIYVIACT
jgi:hypothetical protein